MTTRLNRYIPLPAKSDNPNDYCELCHDTGYYGDNGPGGARHNREYQSCECDPSARSRRRMQRPRKPSAWGVDRDPYGHDKY
jgi:hypothetical protein